MSRLAFYRDRNLAIIIILVRFSFLRLASVEFSPLSLFWRDLALGKNQNFENDKERVPPATDGQSS
jgi:hypothetical protein